MSVGNKAAGVECARLIREGGVRNVDLAAVIGVHPKRISQWKHQRHPPAAYAPAAIKWGLLVLGKSVKIKP